MVNNANTLNFSTESQGLCLPLKNCLLRIHAAYIGTFLIKGALCAIWALRVTDLAAMADKLEIKSSEERITEELRAEILAARAEAKADHLHIAGKVDRIAKSHARRLDALEEKTGSPNPDKH